MSSERKRSYFRALKTLLLERAEYRCEYCGCDLAFDGSEIDHVDPDGSDETANYRISCKSCNASKGRKSLDEFRQYKRAIGIRSQLPHLAFTASQINWLNEQEWFPFRVTEPYVFHFERARAQP